jgi:hypothetical protein
MIEIDLISPNYPGFNVVISGTFQQQGCSYNLIFNDTTTINNPLFDRGTLTYSILDLSGDETVVATGSKGSTAIGNFCEEGIYTVRKRIVIRELVNNCPGQIIYQEYLDFEVNVVEYRPLLTLTETDCCYLINSTLEVLPSEININNNACTTTNPNDAGFYTENPVAVSFDITDVVDISGNIVEIESINHQLPNNTNVSINSTEVSYNGNFIINNVTPDTFEIDIAPNIFAGSATGTFTAILPGRFAFSNFSAWNGSIEGLKYELFYYDLATTLWIKESEQLYGGITSTNPEDFVYTFTPNRLTRYKLEATLTNCCTSVKRETEFVICDSITITRSCQDKIKCDTCNLYYIDNYTQEAITVKAFDLITNKEIHEYIVEPLSRVEHRFTNDGVYSFEYNNKTIVVPVICQIDKCYTNLMKTLLCSNNKKQCCDDIYLENRLANVQAFYQTFLHYIDPYTDLNLRFAKADINKKLNDFQEIGRLRDQILDFCDVCKRNCANCLSWDSGNCL